MGNEEPWKRVLFEQGIHQASHLPLIYNLVRTFQQDSLKAVMPPTSCLPKLGEDVSHIKCAHYSHSVLPGSLMTEPPHARLFVALLRRCQTGHTNSFSNP